MKTSRRASSALALGLVVAALLGCKKDKAQSSETGSTAVAAGSSIGIAECDEYLTKYEKCIKDKVPEAQRGTFQTSMETMRTNWRTMAQNPVTKAGLAHGCRQALDQAKTAMASFGCAW